MGWTPRYLRRSEGNQVEGWSGSRSRNVMDKGKGHSVQGFGPFIWWGVDDQWKVTELWEGGADSEANHCDVILGPVSILCFLFPEMIPTLLPSWPIQKFNRNVEC